jgi:CheY-like chemotaxis protein
MPALDALHPIVLIDDDPLVGELLRELLIQAKVPNLLVAFQTVADLKKFLSEASAAAARSPARVPCLLFVDFNIPGSGGAEIVEWVRNQPNFRKMKVVVLSSSNAEIDREGATIAGADHYHVKYPSPENLASLVRWATLGGDSAPVWSYNLST